MNANEMTHMISPSSLGEKRVICIENLIWGLKVDKVGLLSVNVPEGEQRGINKRLHEQNRSGSTGFDIPIGHSQGEIITFVRKFILKLF